eukprot:1371308-Amphidinium_carterae.3
MHPSHPTISKNKTLMTFQDPLSHLTITLPHSEVVPGHLLSPEVMRTQSIWQAARQALAPPRDQSPHPRK